MMLCERCGLVHDLVPWQREEALLPWSIGVNAESLSQHFSDQRNVIQAIKVISSCWTGKYCSTVYNGSVL